MPGLSLRDNSFLWGEESKMDFSNMRSIAGTFLFPLARAFL
jgi:hypothetical protein